MIIDDYLESRLSELFGAWKDLSLQCTWWMAC